VTKTFTDAKCPACVLKTKTQGTELQKYNHQSMSTLILYSGPGGKAKTNFGFGHWYSLNMEVSVLYLQWPTGLQKVSKVLRIPQSYAHTHTGTP